MIPVLRALLPTYQELLPFLEQIDRNQIYSNFGPLHDQLSHEISRQYNISAEEITLCSSGTAALQVCLLEIIDRSKKAASDLTVAIPNWTFSATVQAALSLGLNVKLVDVDQSGVICRSALEKLAQVIDILIVVAPFGAPLDYQSWCSFAKDKNIELIFDSAASFFTLQPTEFPSVVSMHATKGFSTGEGGFIAARDPAKSSSYRSITSFGFLNSRTPRSLGTNAKLSEYSCAIGLAMAQNIRAIEKDLISLGSRYDAAFSSDSPNIKPFSPPSFARNTYSLRINTPTPSLISKLVSAFSLRAIEVRSWWGAPISSQPIGRYCDISCINAEANNSKLFSESVLGLPYGRHINKHNEHHIIACVKELLG